MIKNHLLLLLLAFFLQSTWGSAFANDHGNSTSSTTNAGLNSSTASRIEQGGDNGGAIVHPFIIHLKQGDNHHE
jgi:hypothetical protein